QDPPNFIALPFTVTDRLKRRTSLAAAREKRGEQLQVAYPRAADNGNGPLASHLRGVNQPVVGSRIGFSASRGVPLAACRHDYPAPLHYRLAGQSVTPLGVAAMVACDREA